MKKYLFLLCFVFFYGCTQIDPKSANANLMNTKQVTFKFKDTIYFVYSTYLGKFCEDDWYKVLNEVPIKISLKNPKKCDFAHYFIVQIFGDDKIGAISVNKKLFKPQIIKQSKITSKLALSNYHNNSYLVLTDPFRGAVAKIEILLESGQFVSLNQQILSKSLFFHQEDEGK